MKMRPILILLIPFFILALLAGCTDKTSDNPTRSGYESGWSFNWPMHFECIMNSTVYTAATQDPGLRGVMVYTPPGYDISGSTRPYPVLYLLPPFEASDLYYHQRGLAEVADRLIAQGKIQPMIIITFDGRSLLGGSFYTNSTRQGNFYTALVRDTAYIGILYDLPGTINDAIIDVFSDALINRIDQTYTTIPERGCRAIGGAGMGGYGAFAVAVKSGLFGSVSAVNAPLDFDAGGNGGFWSLIENEILPGMDWPIDTSGNDLNASLIISAASAFSPHVTSFDSIYYYRNDVSGARTFGYVVGDTLTDDLSTYLPAHQSHVPFDSLGNRNAFIWGLWLRNNIDSLYLRDDFGNAALFTDIPKLVITSADSRFYFLEQMNAFMDFMSSNGIIYEHRTFHGTTTLPPTTEYFMYDLLEDILIFHSANFDMPEGM